MYDIRVIKWNYGGPRTEEGIVGLLSLLLKHHKPKEGIYLRKGRGKGLLGDPIVKDRVRRENHGGQGKFPARSNLLPLH